MLTRNPGVPVGLGGHLFNVDPECFVNLFKLLYVQNAAYYTCAGLVKLSLLCQYLRIFTKGPMRITCLVLLGMTSVWAIFWFIQGWFPCFPVSGFWNRAQQPPPKCWGTGFKTVKGALVAFVGFAGSNMTLDMIIFFVPMTLYLKPGIAARQLLALVALFALGSVYVDCCHIPQTVLTTISQCSSDVRSAIMDSGASCGKRPHRVFRFHMVVSSYHDNIFPGN